MPTISWLDSPVLPLSMNFLRDWAASISRDKLSEIGVDAYFSGCITMTLPKMPERENKGEYICLVDLEKKVREKLQPILEAQGIEVKVITHNRKRDSEMSWEERCEMVKEMLTVYQNARCVVTKRLHCSLPCLAMEVPVFIIKEMEDDIRFDPYYDFFYRTTVTKFMKDEYEYDFLNPPPNKGLHKPYRDELIKVCEDFVNEVKDETRSIDELVKTTYTEKELQQWRHNTMKEAMNNWLLFSREFQIENKKLRKKEAKESREIASLKKKLTIERDRVKRLKEEKKTLQETKRELSRKSKALEKEKRKMLTASSWSIIKFIFRRKFKRNTIKK